MLEKEQSARQRPRANLNRCPRPEIRHQVEAVVGSAWRIFQNILGEPSRG
jgi:hypothetical protein